jgi:hypothetical protein
MQSGLSRTLLRFDPGAANRKSSDRQQLVVSSASMSDLALSVVLGVALAAATGFRVFLPMLIASGAGGASTWTMASLGLVRHRP